jgi:hypothetical protein
MDREPHGALGATMRKAQGLIPTERIERRIFLLRGERVMLSTDLAQLYEGKPRALIQAVKRNADRFPADFMFRLNSREFALLKSQLVTSRWFFDVIRELMTPPEPKRRPIGFGRESE